MNVLVIGSTGKTGLELIKEAMRQGHAVTAFARRPEALHEFPTLNVIKGDALNPSDLEQAMVNQDVVLSALGAPLGQPVGKVRSIGTQNIISAMKAQNVSRLIVVSTIGVDESKPNMGFLARLFIPRIIGAERLEEVERQERLVKASGLNWTLVRPPQLKDGEPLDTVSAASSLKTKFADSLRRADLARFMIEQISRVNFASQAVSAVN